MNQEVLAPPFFVGSLNPDHQSCCWTLQFSHAFSPTFPMKEEKELQKDGY